MSHSSASTRDRILDAAEALFAERGFAGTAVRDIAAQVGIHPASLYNHFAGKQALYEAVLERGLRPLIDVLEQAASAGDVAGRADFIDVLMEHLARTPHLPRLVHHEAVAGGAHLARLARLWIRPLVSQALAVLKRDPDAGGAAGWEPEENQLLIAAWLHLIFGHFAMAPLLAEVFDEDPLSREQVERQTRFLRKIALRLFGPADGAKEDPPDATG